MLTRSCYEWKKKNNDDNEFLKAWNEYVKSREDAKADLLEVLNDFDKEEDSLFDNRNLLIVAGTLVICGILGAYVWHIVTKN